jgi:hypothetical protein
MDSENSKTPEDEPLRLPACIEICNRHEWCETALRLERKGVNIDPKMVECPANFGVLWNYYQIVKEYMDEEKEKAHGDGGVP